MEGLSKRPEEGRRYMSKEIGLGGERKNGLFCFGSIELCQ